MATRRQIYEAKVRRRSNTIAAVSTAGVFAALILLIPLVGAILFIVWMATEGDQMDNQYGPPPA